MYSLQNTLNVIIITIIISLNISCTIPKNILQYQDISQGNLLNSHDIKKIKIGMTKDEISKNIGLPTLKNIFGLNIWYYIYYHYHHNKIIQQQTLILTFDKNDILINFKK